MEAEPPKASPPKRKRRWFQFSMRTLLIVVTLLAIPMGWVGWQVRIVSHRNALKEVLRQRNRGLSGLPDFVPLDEYPVLPWYRSILGDTTWPGLYLDRNAFSDDEIQEFREAFPEIKFVIAQDVGFKPDPINYP